MQTPFTRELTLAQSLAKKAGELQLSRRRSFGAVGRKNDLSPVTAVDTECERIIRTGLLEAFPADGFLGEESGRREGTSGRVWIVDPVDGTRPYVRDIPTFSVLIALEDADGPALGIIYLPAQQQMCYAQRNKGAWLNQARISVSGVQRLSSAMGSGLGHLQKAATPEGAALFELMKSWDYAYGFMDAYSYVLAASGKLDICVNLLDKPWDCAAAACIISEAGGRYSDIDGVQSIHNGSIILTNGLLHDQALAFFAQRHGSTGGGSL